MARASHQITWVFQEIIERSVWSNYNVKNERHVGGKAGSIRSKSMTQSFKNPGQMRSIADVMNKVGVLMLCF